MKANFEAFSDCV